MTQSPAMREYIQHVRRANRTDVSLSVTCYVSAAIFYFYSIFVEGVRYGSLLQFLALMLLVAGIYVNQRYSWTNYIYMIRAIENKNSGEITGYNFAVHRVQGKKSVCLADIPCRDIVSIDACTSDSKIPESIKDRKDINRYSFTQTMMPAVFHTAVFNADGGTVAVKFEPDEVIVGMLESCVMSKTNEQ